jgi:hypothetical protein
MVVPRLDDDAAADDAVVEQLELAGVLADIGFHRLRPLEVAKRDLQRFFQGLSPCMKL